MIAMQASLRMLCQGHGTHHHETHPATPDLRTNSIFQTKEFYVSYRAIAK